MPKKKSISKVKKKTPKKKIKPIKKKVLKKIIDKYLVLCCAIMC